MIGQIKLVCFYGPESTGKTAMAQKMAQRFSTVWVPEVAREMISSNTFNREDIIAIGREQTARVFALARQANRILFCDTDVITTQIYSRHYLGVVPPVLYEFEKMVQYDQYFLFDIDVPWVGDGLRDLGDQKKREEMAALFKSELNRRNLAYTLVQGNWAEREAIVLKGIEKLMA
jgi:HTH-type transcriptional repressor of NAD biosynthesis genes